MLPAATDLPLRKREFFKAAVTKKKENQRRPMGEHHSHNLGPGTEKDLQIRLSMVFELRTPR
jgi:hypothetical protein